MTLPVRLQETESQSPTTPFSEPWLSNLRRGLGMIGTTPTLMAGFSIDKDQHRKIEERLSNLKRAITPSGRDRQAIGIELAKLVSAFPSQDQGNVGASLRIEAYSEALSMAPAWAVRDARLRIIRGEVAGLDQRFAPSPPQFASIVNELVKPFRADLATLEALATVEPEATREERARVSEGLDALRAEMVRAPDPSALRAADEAALRGRLVANGFDAADFDKVPDAKNGTWKHA